MVISYLGLFEEDSRAYLQRKSIHTTREKSIKTSSALCEEEWIEKDPEEGSKQNLSQSIP